MTVNFESYLKSIQADLRRGNATEYTYRSALEALIESAGRGIDASNDPKHIECGAPDFIVERRKVPLGYIETKDIGVDLDRVEKSDQMKRYLKALHNLILTDYIEFRWYVNGEKRLTTHLATRTAHDKLVLNPLGAKQLEEMLRGFIATETPTVNTPKELAERLADVTHFIAEQIERALASGDAEIRQPLEEQYRIFTEMLLPALKPGEFADLYAQTVTYGLFAAKISAPEGDPFSLEDAYKYLRRIPFLRTLFMNVNEQLDEIDIIRPYLQDIVSLLNRSNIHDILADFGRHTRTEDPVVHFYETFLAKYDPKMRESRGVYYTPEPVVQFIVRSVDEVLKTRFNKPWGLADDSVKVLDPAAGTGTFLYYVIQRVHDEIVNVRGQGGQWAQKSKLLLNRLFGFELLIPSYTISHLKLGLLMNDLGAPLEGRDERVHVYLTNTLEQGVAHEGMLPTLGHGIAKESSEAEKVKQDKDIMVVLGNPPYSAVSGNTGEWITNQVREHYYPHDEIKEHNPKLLLDDYVKFIRYGEWRINKSGQGVLAFITNHSYLDNPTFREMRKHLMKTFDEIYVVDLHGNAFTNVITTDGSKDENVFDIQQGVAIIFCVTNKSTNLGSSSLKHIDVFGSRTEKYSFLNSKTINSIEWDDLTPRKPFYLFIHQNEDLWVEYDSYWRLTDIFNEYSTGIKTHRDHFAISFENNVLIRRILDFVNINMGDQQFRNLYDLPDTRDWKLHDKRLSLRKENNFKYFFSEILYRPFDTRNIYFHPDVVELPRMQVMKNLQKENLCLLANRQVRVSEISHFFVSEKIVDFHLLETANAALYCFPEFIYLEDKGNQTDLFHLVDSSRISNYSPNFINAFSKQVGLRYSTDNNHNLLLDFGPDDLFFYIYSISYNITYRTRYAEFLKIDFPRIPLTSDKALFADLVKKGRELVDLHLLKSPKVENFITTYPVSGDNVVDKPRYEDGKVWINPAQYFGGVPEAVWHFKIGGYQVCDKWLKDRKGRVLSSEDISHYQRVVVALNETIRLMKEIDEAIPKWPIE